VGIAELCEGEACRRFTIRLVEEAGDFVGLTLKLQERREFVEHADPDRRSRDSEKRPSIHSIFHFLFPFLIAGASALWHDVRNQASCASPSKTRWACRLFPFE
jgi:hypothetical protein